MRITANLNKVKVPVKKPTKKYTGTRSNYSIRQTLIQYADVSA